MKNEAEKKSSLDLGHEFNFMMQEHRLLYETYEHLYTILYQFIRLYFGIIAVPISLFLAFFRDTQMIGIKVDNLPVLIAGIILLLSIVGIIFLAIIVMLRFRMIFYAKSTNCSRRYFVDNDQNTSLKEYLALPTTNEKPKYYEGFGHHFPFLVVLIAFLNTFLFWVALLNIAKSFKLSIIVAFIIFCSQYFLYRYIAEGKDHHVNKQ